MRSIKSEISACITVSRATSNVWYATVCFFVNIVLVPEKSTTVPYIRRTHKKSGTDECSARMIFPDETELLTFDILKFEVSLDYSTSTELRDILIHISIDWIDTSDSHNTTYNIHVDR